MKKILITWTLAAFVAGCSEQKLVITEPPRPVIKSFGLAYPEVEPVKWVKENQKGKTVYAAAFKRDGKKSEAEFDENGKFIREHYR